MDLTDKADMIFISRILTSNRNKTQNIINQLEKRLPKQSDPELIESLKESRVLLKTVLQAHDTLEERPLNEYELIGTILKHSRDIINLVINNHYTTHEILDISNAMNVSINEYLQLRQKKIDAQIIIEGGWLHTSLLSAF